MTSGRLEAFCDGILAIIAIMVLELEAVNESYLKILF